MLVGGFISRFTLIHYQLNQLRDSNHSRTAPNIKYDALRLKTIQVILHTD